MQRPEPQNLLIDSNSLLKTASEPRYWKLLWNLPCSAEPTMLLPNWHTFFKQPVNPQNIDNTLPQSKMKVINAGILYASFLLFISFSAQWTLEEMKHIFFCIILSVCLSRDHTSLIFVTELSWVLAYYEFTMSVTGTIYKHIFSPFVNQLAKIICTKRRSVQ